MKKWIAFALTMVMVVTSLLSGMPTARAAVTMTQSITDKQYNLAVYDWDSAAGSATVLSRAEKANTISATYKRDAMDQDVIDGAGNMARMVLVEIAGFDASITEDATFTVDGRAFSVDSAAAYYSQCGLKNGAFVMPLMAPYNGMTDTYVIQAQWKLEDGSSVTKVTETAKVTVQLVDNTLYMNKTITDKLYGLGVYDWNSENGIADLLAEVELGSSVAAEYAYDELDADETGTDAGAKPMALLHIDGVSVVDYPQVTVDGLTLAALPGAAYAGSVGYVAEGESASIIFPVELTKEGYTESFIVQLTGLEGDTTRLTETIKVSVKMKNAAGAYDVTVLDWISFNNSMREIGSGKTAGSAQAAEAVVAEYYYDSMCDVDYTGKWSDGAKMALVKVSGLPVLSNVVFTIDGQTLSVGDAAYADEVGYHVDGEEAYVMFPVELTKAGYEDYYYVKVSGTDADGKSVEKSGIVHLLLENKDVYKSVGTAKITNIGSTGDGSVYIVGDTIYMDYAGEAGTPSFYVEFAKEDGSAFTEIAYAFTNAWDGETYVGSYLNEDVKLSESRAQLNLNKTAQEIDGNKVTLIVETETHFYETKHYTIEVMENVSDLYWKKAEYVNGVLKEVSGDPQKGFLTETNESGFYSLYIKDEYGSFVRLSNAQMQSLEVENWDVLSAMALGDGSDFIKVVPKFGGMMRLFYEADGRVYRTWSMAQVETYSIYRGAADTTEELNAFLASEEFIDILNRAPESMDVELVLNVDADYFGEVVIPEGLPRKFSIKGNSKWVNGYQFMTDMLGSLKILSDLDTLQGIDFYRDENYEGEYGIQVLNGADCDDIINNRFMGHGVALEVQDGSVQNFSNNILRFSDVGVAINSAATAPVRVGQNDFINSFMLDIATDDADLLNLRPNFYGDGDGKLQKPRVAVGEETIDAFPVFAQDVALEGPVEVAQLSVYDVADDGSVTFALADDGSVENKRPVSVPVVGSSFAVTYDGTAINDWTYDAQTGLMTIPVALRGTGDYVVKPVQEVLVTLTSRLAGVSGQSIAQLQGGGLYEMGKTVQVTAPTLMGCKFLGWYAAADNDAGYDGEKLSDQLSYSFAAQADVSLVAVYQATGTSGRFKVYGSDYMLNGTGPKKGAMNRLVEVGMPIALEYVGDDQFLYWKNGSDKIVSRDKSYSFTFVADTELSLAVVDPENMSDGGVYCALIEFVSDYGQVMYADTWYSTDTAAELPAGPSKPGCTFTGWEYTVEEIISKIDGTAGVVTVHPVYAEGDATAQITVSNNVDDIVRTHTMQVGQTLWVEAPVRDGWTFSHMEDAAGRVITYSASHAFWVSGDYAVNLVYVQQEEPVEKMPTILMADSKRIEENGRIKAVFTVMRDVPQGFMLMEHGVLVNRDGTLTDSEAELEMVIGSGKAIRVASSDPAAMGTYVQYVTATTAGAKIYCRGYLIYGNADGEVLTLYTDVASVAP